MTPSQHNHATKRVPCTSCGAAANQDCVVRRTGKPTEPHEARRKAYAAHIAQQHPERPEQTLYFYKTREQVAGLEGEFLIGQADNPAEQARNVNERLERFQTGELRTLIVHAAQTVGWRVCMVTDKLRVVFLGAPEAWEEVEKAQAQHRVVDARVREVALPTRTMPDWAKVAKYARRRGAVRLGEEVTEQMAKSAHVSLHRRGIGIYRMRSAEGDPAGWLVQPLKGSS